VAGRLLKLSPHVLYTNVVEPVLRFMFVKKGYVLMHAACIAPSEDAFLITARTDTGKTSTILRLLAQYPFGFLSDDMVILHPDGRVLCYPKPLTISSHTLAAVDGGADLSRIERLALQIQSRIHSRSGRRFAFILARLPLPVATINSIVQLVIPPPKYSITRLVQGLVLQREAVIRHRVEIERGPEHEAVLAPDVAEATALANCDDAYGFPPYRELEPFLTIWDGQDLRATERRMIGEALGRCATTLVRSQSYNWWPRIAELANATEESAPLNRESMVSALLSAGESVAFERA
jgi:dolichol-phosphate mannosyltransferase